MNDTGSHMEHAGKTLKAAIFLNLGFVLAEVITGYFSHSLAILSDAGHNLVDVLGLAVAWFSFWLSGRKSSPHYTYGFRKVTIYAALINIILLLFITIMIIPEAISRFRHPGEVNGKNMVIIGIGGIVINSLATWIMMFNEKKELNIRTAIFHSWTDALVSVGVLISGIFVIYKNWLWMDPVMSLVISFFILFGTWTLFRRSVRLSLDGVPSKIDLQKIKNELLKLEGVDDIHDLHIWALGTFQNAVTVHISVTGNPDLNHMVALKKEIRRVFVSHEIEHITIEIESEDQDCNMQDC